jgi:hypothetical protein
VTGERPPFACCVGNSRRSGCGWASRRQLGFLLEEFGRRVPDVPGGSRVTWCFDKIQLVPDWERFVRRLLGKGGIEVVVTGLSAALLSREIATRSRRPSSSSCSDAGAP